MSARLTDQQRRDRSLTEEEFVGQVDDLAEILGFRWVRVGPLRTTGGLWKTPTRGPLGKGWPDTVYIHARSGRTIYVEFKSELGKTSPDQNHVLGFLKGAGLETYVWRPSDFDRIAEVLR